MSNPFNETLNRYLTDPVEAAAYLNVALETGDKDIITTALSDIVRSKGMAQIAKDTGLGSESLYESLSPGGHAAFGTILQVVEALGLRLHALPATEDEAADSIPK